MLISVGQGKSRHEAFRGGIFAHIKFPIKPLDISTATLYNYNVSTIWAKDYSEVHYGNKT